MAYDVWELGFESSRSGAGRKQWPSTVKFKNGTLEKIDEAAETTAAWDERELGFESSRNTVSANKKLSHCSLTKQIVLLDSDMIVWDK